MLAFPRRKKKTTNITGEGSGTRMKGNVLNEIR